MIMLIKRLFYCSLVLVIPACYLGLFLEFVESMDTYHWRVVGVAINIPVAAIILAGVSRLWALRLSDFLLFEKHLLKSAFSFIMILIVCVTAFINADYNVYMLIFGALLHVSSIVWMYYFIDDFHKALQIMMK